MPATPQNPAHPASRDVTADVQTAARNAIIFLAPQAIRLRAELSPQTKADLARAAEMLKAEPEQVVIRAVKGVIQELRSLLDKGSEGGIHADPKNSSVQPSIPFRQLKFAGAVLDTYFTSQQNAQGALARQVAADLAVAMQLMVHGNASGLQIKPLDEADALKAIGTDLHAASRQAASLADSDPAEDEAEKHYLVSATYQQWDAEAYEAGECSEQGWHTEDTVMEASDVARLARRLGISAASSTHAEDGTYFSSTEPDTDRQHYEQGVDTFYSLHIRAEDGSALSPAEMVEIAAKINVQLEAPKPVATKSLRM